MRLIEAITDIDAPPQEVWDVLMDFPSHAAWNPFIHTIEGNAKVGETLKVVLKTPDGGEGLTMAPCVVQVSAPRHFAWRGQLRFPGAFEGTHEFLVQALGEGTRFVHKEQFRGFLVPFVGRILRETQEGFARMNQALAQEVMARRLS